MANTTSLNQSPSWPYPGENAYAPSVSSDPVRSYTPFTPSTGNTGASVQLPMLGIAILAGVILLLEWRRLKKFGK